MARSGRGGYRLRNRVLWEIGRVALRAGDGLRVTGRTVENRNVNDLFALFPTNSPVILYSTGMRKFIFLSALIAVATSGLAQSLVEGFEAGPPTFMDFSNIAFGNVPGGQPILFSGEPWYALNASTPIGGTGWFRSSAFVHSGDSSLGSAYTAVGGNNLINNFFMSPPRIFSNGDTISFWTRTQVNPTSYPDRLILKLSTSGTSTSIGNFTTTLGEVNPALSTTAYPAVFTQYTAVLSLASPVTGRFAFNYNVPNGGPSGTNGDVVVIDDVEYTRAGMVESFDSSTTPGFLDGSVQTFGNTAGGNDIQFPSGTWRAVNVSTPVGTTGWFKGNGFPARTGPGLINANFQNTTGNNTINNFMMSPVRVFANGDRIRFWTRAVDAPAFADRLSLRLSTDGPSTAPASFNRVLLTINPTLATTGFPNVWTQFTGVVSGLTAPTTGRFAFNYEMPNGGPSGPNSQYIGIDDVEHIPAPATQRITGILGLSDTGSFAPGVTRVMSYEVRQAGNLVAAGKFTAGDPEPTYAIDVPYTVNGPCTLTFDGSSFLKASGTVTLNGSTLNLSGPLMFNGDVDKSGEVDAVDIDLVIAGFGDTFPGPGDPDTDVDVSGEVDAVDIDIVISNFGRVDE